MKEEGLTQTAHNKIFIGKPSKITNEELENKISTLKELIADENVKVSKIKRTMHKLVPTYKEVKEEKKLSKETRPRIDGKRIKIILKTVEKIKTQNKKVKVEVG